MDNYKISIAIIGASGFIGSRVSQYLLDKGYKVVLITRNMIDNDDLLGVVNNCDAVINLAGAPISKRWSKRYKNILWDSRIGVTKKIVNAVNQSPRVKLFISASAVGLYPENECCDEKCKTFSDSFLSKLCVDWEKSASNVRDDVRLVITRFGVVFDENQGAFIKMSLPFKIGFATTITNQNNYISWIDIRDVVRAMNFIIENNSLRGVFNFTSPQTLTQKIFSELLSEKYRTYLNLNISRKIVSIAFGESSQVITQSVCVKPMRLLESGYIFISPSLNDFLFKRDVK